MTGAPHIASVQDLAEGYDYLAGSIQASLRLAWAYQRDFPYFVASTGPYAKMGLDNPDTLYFHAYLRDDAEYVVTGRRGTTADLSFQVLKGDYSPVEVPDSLSAFDDRAVEIAGDGTFELRFGPAAPAPGYFRLDHRAVPGRQLRRVPPLRPGRAWRGRHRRRPARVGEPDHRAGGFRAGRLRRRAGPAARVLRPGRQADAGRGEGGPGPAARGAGGAAAQRGRMAGASGLGGGGSRAAGVRHRAAADRHHRTAPAAGRRPGAPGPRAVARGGAATPAAPVGLGR
jgi:hypothetical protein